MGNHAIMEEIPKCDFCEEEALYDGKTKLRGGAWAYMCPLHWMEYGVGKLGTGFGQKLELYKEPEPGFKEPEPSIGTLNEWMEDGVCHATDGCHVEIDGTCRHGKQSWFLELGLL